MAYEAPSPAPVQITTVPAISGGTTTLYQPYAGPGYPVAQTGGGAVHYAVARGADGDAMRYVLLRSTDGGQSWQAVRSGSEWIHLAHDRTGDRLWAVLYNAQGAAVMPRVVGADGTLAGTASIPGNLNPFSVQVGSDGCLYAALFRTGISPRWRFGRVDPETMQWAEIGAYQDRTDGWEQVGFGIAGTTGYLVQQRYVGTGDGRSYSEYRVCRVESDWATVTPLASVRLPVPSYQAPNLRGVIVHPGGDIYLSLDADELGRRRVYLLRYRASDGTLTADAVAYGFLPQVALASDGRLLIGYIAEAYIPGVGNPAILAAYDQSLAPLSETEFRASSEATSEIYLQPFYGGGERLDVVVVHNESGQRSFWQWTGPPVGDGSGDPGGSGDGGSVIGTVDIAELILLQLIWNG